MRCNGCRVVRRGRDLLRVGMGRRSGSEHLHITTHSLSRRRGSPCWVGVRRRGRMLRVGRAVGGRMGIFRTGRSRARTLTGTLGSKGSGWRRGRRRSRRRRWRWRWMGRIGWVGRGLDRVRGGRMGSDERTMLQERGHRCGRGRCRGRVVAATSHVRARRR